ncbi:MAG: hypothetical protein AB7O66_05225 [Limisphaerales bacterium]
MSRKALGRGLNDLLRGAQPARAVDRATAAENQDPAPPSTPNPVPAAPPAPGSQPRSLFPPTSPFAAPKPDPSANPHAATPVPVPPIPVPVPVASPNPKPGESSREPSAPSTSPRFPSPQAPRFGQAYSPPPAPLPPPGRAGLYVLLVIDVLLMAAAGVLTFGPWVERPLSLYLAAAAVLAGGLLACGAIAYQAAPHRPPPDNAHKPSRVRVRLTRL